jgi:Chlorophyll A-B binding protein
MLHASSALCCTAAELKHGRVAMLAVVGFIVAQYVHLPAEQFTASPLGALTRLPLAAHLQIFGCKYTNTNIKTLHCLYALTARI